MKFTNLKQCMDELVKEYHVPSVDCLVYKEHEEVFRYYTGMSDIENNKKISGNELYIIFSMTKMLTCTCALQLWEQGKFSMDDPLSMYFREFERMQITQDELDTHSAVSISTGSVSGESIEQGVHGYAENPITIKDLFTMSAGLDYDISTPEIQKRIAEGKTTTREIVGALSKTVLGFEPGTRFRYSLCHDILGALIELWSGMAFGEYMTQNLLEPLGMQHTFFGVPKDDNLLSQMAARYTFDNQGHVIRLPLECVYNVTEHYESGGAGLISCTKDYALFLDALANEGIGKSGKKILSPASVELMRTNQLKGEQLEDFDLLRKGYGYGMGVRTHIDPRRSGSKSPIGEFGWDGAGGAFALVDVKNKISLTYFQQIHAWNIEIQNKIKNALYEDLKFMEYRNIRIGQIGDSETIKFAVQELMKYLKQMDSHLIVEILQTEKRENYGQIIWVGVDKQADDGNDTIAISVEDRNGYITGSNERSVLIAVYRFLKELGCNWVRPGKEGERIPDKKIENICVKVKETASYRHRGVCIEGANSYENVLDMIDYLPKIGMNSYFNQFHLPAVFFERWNEKLSHEEIQAMVISLESEIAKRQLLYHKTGHGWTCEPFGIEGTSWGTFEGTLTADVSENLALLDGKRQFFGNIPLNTNLCYSNPKVRDRMTDAIVTYCKENSNIDFLHLWLADGANNHCECDACVAKRPADWYIILLNELDEKLTKAKLYTKVVFLIYVDLLWEPVEERLNNQERFVMMFAPITRKYGENYSDHFIYDADIPPYVRNKVNFPDSLAQNLAQLRNWQKQFKGDSFDFDYHLMWAHLNDVGYENCARNLFEDMKALRPMGLNGMISCQVQRCFFPTALPFYMMAEVLWNDNCDYEAKVVEYYESAFGTDGEKVHKYLKTISDLMTMYQNPGYSHPSYFSGGACKDYQMIKHEVEVFLPAIKKNIEDMNEVYREEWTTLLLHSEYVSRLIAILELIEKQCVEQAKQKYIELREFLQDNEIQIQKQLDCWNAIDHWSRII